MTGPRLSISTASMTSVPEHLLLLEDNPSYRGYLKKHLELAGFSVECACIGVDRLDDFYSREPQLAILDLDVPVLSGFRLLRLLRTQLHPSRRQVPLLVVTGYDFEEVEDVVIEARPEGFLKKPFEPDQLVAKVAFLLEACEVARRVSDDCAAAEHFSE